MKQEKPWWDSEEYLGAITNEDEASMVVPRIVAEAERRGREKALEEIRSAAMPIGEMQVWRKDQLLETRSGYYLPKSFFES